MMTEEEKKAVEEANRQTAAHYSELKTAYQLAFNSPAGKSVLIYLAWFCRARETCVIPGDRDSTYVLEGRREVYLRIQDFLDRTPEDLVTICTKPLEGGKTNGRIKLPDDE